MEEELYSCRSCVHSRVSIIDRFFALIFNLGRVERYDFKCAKYTKDTPENFDPVLGYDRVKSELETCYNVRDRGPCGVKGKGWSPRRKKDLFRMLKKDLNIE